MSAERLDALLVKRGLAGNKKQAAALILENQVLVSGLSNKNPSSQVPAGAHIQLRGVDNEPRYVSRGAHKLAHALATFHIAPEGMVALDVGASTGGFTDVLLKKGARKIYAIDVGYGQLAWPLRQDHRVVVLERENVRYLDPRKIGEPIDLAVIDVSFISLTKVLEKVCQLMGGVGGKTVVALLKPQFEARREQVEKGGVVRDARIRQQCIDNVVCFAKQKSFEVGAAIESPIRGPAGNIEYLIEFTTPCSRNDVMV